MMKNDTNNVIELYNFDRYGLRPELDTLLDL